MKIQDLANTICGDLVRRVVDQDGKNFVITPFRYPDGDFVNVYIDGFGEDFYLSDRGDTIFKFRVSGLTCTESRMNLIDSVCRLHGLIFEKPRFKKKLNMGATGADFLSFCEAISRISTMDYEAGPRELDDFPEEVEQFVKHSLDPIRPSYKQWTLPTLDEKKAFSVDYHFNGKGEPRHMFQIASVQKIDRVCAVVGFLRSHEVRIPTICVVGKKVELRGGNLDRLKQSSEQIVVGVHEHAEFIREFVVDSSAYPSPIGA